MFYAMSKLIASLTMLLHECCNDFYNVYYSTQPWNFLTENEDLEGNTGFYFVRSNNRTISLFREAIKTMIE